MSLNPSVAPSDYKLFAQEDKLAHFVMYFVMSFLLAQALTRKKKVFWIFCIVLPSFYGFIMEILQDWMDAGRQFEIFDILANIFGAFTGTMLIYMLYKIKRRNK